MEKWLKYSTNDKIMNHEIEKFDGDFSIFQNNIKFGTAGLRGVMGLGSEKINYITISMAADSYGKYLKQKHPRGEIKVVVANDNRINGDLYKQACVNELSKYGITVYIAGNNEMIATPLLSYYIRRLKAHGGINITASHNPKEYNGFKVYNKHGAQLMPNESEKISNFMDAIKIENFNLADKAPHKDIDKKFKEEYIDDLTKSADVAPNLRVAYSPMHGTGIHLAEKIFNKLGVEAHLESSQMIRDENFSSVSSPNPEDFTSYKRVVKLMRKTKSDIGLVTDPDADRVGTVVKYKKRYKYITGNDFASIYLNHLLSTMKSIPKDAYIVKSNVSTDLANRIAESYGVKVIEVEVGFKNIADTIQNTKGTFLFAFEESYGFLTNANIARDKDAFQGIVAITEMASHFKAKNTDIYSELMSLWEKYGIHRNIQISKKVSDASKKMIFESLSKTKYIGTRKVLSRIDYRKSKQPQNKIKINLENGSWIIVRPSGTEPKIKIYAQTVSKRGQQLMDIVRYEKEIQNFLDDSTETFNDKKFSLKVIAKYITFLLFVIGILTAVFFLVYDSSDGSIFGDVLRVKHTQPAYFWLGMVVTMMVFGTLSAWMRKRLISFQGQKVSMKHILISSYMSTFISYVTPLSIGGDAIGYWYLRRKGFKRGPLLSSFITSTILWQIGTIMQSAIFIPVGWPIYKMVFDNGSAESHAALIMFIINISWDIFATIMILSLAFGRRFQEWIVRNAITFLEWLPFVNIYDPALKASSYQYEFREMRNGMKKLWGHKWIILEVFIYEMAPKFFIPQALFFSCTDFVQDGLPRGKYWSQIIAIDLASTANSMSITPGGSGTAEWLNITVNKMLFNPIDVGGSPKTTASSWDLLIKSIYSWPWLAFSVLLIGTIITGESRHKAYRIKNKNAMVRKEKIAKTATSFYRIISIPWTVLIIGWLVYVAVL